MKERKNFLSAVASLSLSSSSFFLFFLVIGRSVVYELSSFFFSTTTQRRKEEDSISTTQPLPTLTFKNCFSSRTISLYAFFFIIV
jgi:hypothetical protein